MSEIDNVKNLMLLAYRLKARRLRFHNFEIEYGTHDKMNIENKISTDVEDKVPTEDELLFWSTDYEPNIKPHEPE